MEYTPYPITLISFLTHDTFILRVERRDASITYLPGDYSYIKNPHALTPLEERPFSIASSPTNTSYIEFCIKIYGDWTRQLSQLNPGALIHLSLPQHDTTLANTYTIVFLVGGVGIAPVMSMLRYIIDKRLKKEIIIIYGNKTEKDIIYLQELNDISASHPEVHITHILSEEPDGSPWKGKRGFITRDNILNASTDLRGASFYIFGNPVFITFALQALHELNIGEDRIINRKK